MNKTILITGATSGFGHASAILFAKNDWNVIATGRRQERLDELAEQLGRDRVLPIALDVRDRQMVQQTFSKLPATFTPIDVLLNNAGLALGLQPAHLANLDDWDQMIDTNIKGLIYCTRAILPGMVERCSGHVINLGSVAGDYPYPGGNTYGATKAFVKQFSLNLRADLSGTQVRVTDIEPGLAESEFSLMRFKGDQEKADAVYQGTRPLRPEDIAEMIYWVANLPPHVNINRLEVMPTCQSFAPFTIHREP
jgi:3-hydroxy acid dehydrogenase/malonic semialdehyde reductase